MKTYTFPAPSATSTLPDEIQEITVVVTCSECSPAPGDLTLKGYKAKRESDVE